MKKKQTPQADVETKSQVEASTDSLWIDSAIQRLKQTANPSSQVDMPRELNSRYQLQSEIGSGTFGIVYRAQDNKLGRKVAIKQLRTQYSRSSEFCERFAREAALAGQIEHVNVARVYDSHIEDEDAYLVMEYVEGASLAQLNLQQSTPDIKIACRLVKAAADGLAEAHNAGLVHRDVKAANILVTEDLDRVCLTDFGLAQDQKDASTGVAGSLAYMSPEHLDPKRRVDERADIYSMGIVLFELLSGTRPFDGTGDALRQQILFATAPSVIQKNAGVPRDVATITEKCLRKDPSERYQTAAELADDLQAWLEGRPIQARPVGTSGRLLRWAKREPLEASLATILALGIMAAVVLGAISIQEIVRQRDRANSSAEFANSQTDHFLNVVDLTVNRIDQKLKQQPNSQQLRQDILFEVASQLQQVTSDLQDAPEFSLQLVNVHIKLGGIFTVIGQTKKAEEQYRQAVTVAESIYSRDPKSVESASVYTSALLTLADCQTTYQFKLDEASKSCNAALDIANRHEDQAEMSQVRLVALRCLADIAMRKDDSSSTQGYLSQAMQIAETNEPDNRLSPEEITRTLEAIGDFCFRESDFATSVGFFQQALERRQQQLNADPDSSESIDALIHCLISLSRSQTNHLMFSEALSHGQRALELSQGQSSRFPSDRARQRTLAVSCDAMGTLYNTCGDSVKAKQAYGQALKIHQSLVGTDSGNQELIWDLASQHVMLGDSFMADFRPDRARSEYETAKDLVSQIDISTESTKEKDTIDQQLSKCGYVKLVDADALTAEMLQGQDSIVVGSRLLQLVMDGQYKEAQDLASAIEPLEGQLNSLDKFNVACIYASSRHQLAELGLSSKTEESKRLEENLRQETFRVLVALKEGKELDPAKVGPSLHRTPYLRSLHDQPQMKEIISGIPDPLMHIEAASIGSANIDITL